MAGYKTNEMLQVMEPTIKANIAFGGDMATTADLMTDSLSALSMGAEEAEYYLNVVAQTSRNANTSGTQLMEAYIEAGSTLNKLNIPLEESAKILGVMAENGLKGSEAGNSLQSVLVNLMGTTSTTAGALKALGVESYDSEGKFRGLETVLNDIVVSASKMTDEQADMNLALLGGKTQLTALNNMLKATDEKYINLENSIKNSDGALEEMYKTMSDNTQGTWLETQSKIEAMAKSFGDMLLPIVNDVIKVIGNLADWLGSLDEGTRKVILGVSAFIVALGPILIILGQLITSVGAITGALGALSTAIGSAGGLMAFFTTSMLPVITTVGAVIGVVVALAMAIKENWEGIKSATQSLIDKCEPAFEGLKNAFSTLWDTCMDIYNTVIQPLFRLIGEVIEVCIQLATPLLILLMDQFSNVMNVISVAWAVVGKPVFSAIMAIVQTVWTIVKPILSAFASLFSSIMSTISAIWNAIGSPVFNGIINVVKSISNVVGPAFETFKNTIANAMNYVLTPIQWVIDKLKSLTDWIGGVGKKVGGFISSIGNLFGGSSRSIDVDLQANDIEPVALSGNYYNADTRKALDFRSNLDNITVGATAYSSKNNELLNVDELVSKLTDGISTALLGALSGLQLQTNLNLDSKPIGKAIAPLIDTEIAKIQRRRF